LLRPGINEDVVTIALATNDAQDRPEGLLHLVASLAPRPTTTADSTPSAWSLVVKVMVMLDVSPLDSLDFNTC